MYKSITKYLTKHTHAVTEVALELDKAMISFPDLPFQASEAKHMPWPFLVHMMDS